MVHWLNEERAHIQHDHVLFEAGCHDCAFVGPIDVKNCFTGIFGRSFCRLCRVVKASDKFLIF
jgi:hypothetical protein